MDNFHFHQNLRFLRTKRGLTQRELASVVRGCNESSYRHYEKGNVPNIHKIKVLADFFNVTVDELCFKNLAKLNKANKAIIKRARVVFNRPIDYSSTKTNATD
jgi:transcriptional regulator with XRE-family HTH domain